MKKAILGVLVVLVLAVGGLCAYIATRPAEYTVTRISTYNAPPSAIFEQINDFHKWEAWSPWAKLDPQMKVTYSGAPAGQGASYAWVGNSDVGEGRMTIVESRPPEHIKIDLEFIQPFAASSVTEFAIKPTGDKTNVTWSMKGQNNFLSKAFSLFVDMDTMLGSDFEKGLAQLKPIVETGQAANH